MTRAKQQTMNIPLQRQFLPSVPRRFPVACAIVVFLAPIASADDTAVSFSADVLPILQKNCLACHNESEYEGELILESVETINNGGDSGPTIIAGNAEESLMYQVASYEQEPVMPPLDNDVGAERFTSEELALLKRWIDQGAKAESESDAKPTINWRPIPDEHASVLAVELSPNGRWLASGRGNRLLLHSVTRKQLHQTLADPALSDTHPDAAHLDSVQSIAWSPDGESIASGGYRVVKIWRRSESQVRETTSAQEATTPDGGYRVVIDAEQEGAMAFLYKGEEQITPLPATLTQQDVLSRMEFEHGVRQQHLQLSKSDLEAAKKRKTDAEKDVTKAEEDIKKADAEVVKKQEALQKAEESVQKQEQALRDLDNKLAALDKPSQSDEAKPSDEDARVQEQTNAERKRLQDEIKKAKQELEKRQKDRDKKKQELTETETVAERSRSAKTRLEEIVQQRAKAIEAAEGDVAAHEQVVATSEADLKTAKETKPAPWQTVRINDAAPKDSAEFVLDNGQTEVYVSAASGQTVSIQPSGSGPWEIVATLGDPNGDSPFADRVTSLAFRDDGKVLAIGGGEPSRSGEVQLWDTTSWTQIESIADIHSDVVYDLQFAPLGNLLASSASDRMVKIVDSSTAKYLRTLEGHTGHVLGVSWFANGRLLATAGADQAVKVWDAKEGGQKKTISGIKGEITAVRYLGLEDRMIFATGRGELHSRDSQGKGKPGLSKLTDYVHRISTSRDGKTIAAAGTERVIRVWNSDGKQIAEFN